MGAIANLSIRNKLLAIILGTTVLSLTVGFGLVIGHSLRSFQEELRQATALTARVLGNYSALPLDFDDMGLAETQLEQAQIDQLGDVMDVEAFLYEADGSLFAYYGEVDDELLPVTNGVTFAEIRDGYLHHSEPIYHDGELLGTMYLRVKTDAYRARIRDYLRYMGLLMGALVLVALVFAYLLQAVISKPILRLAEAARRISDNADYSERVKKPGNDEIGLLYDGFNSMLSQIEQRQGELERSNRDLNEFAHVVSHDLKAPLRNIANLSSWLHEDEAARLTDEGRDQLGMLRKRVKRMESLIDGILQYSRLGRGGSAATEVNVREMLDDLIEIVDAPATMSIEVVTPMPTLRTERLRLEQVFGNLINNAVHYHDHPDGRIEIASFASDGSTTFSVTDDGPGIDPTHHETIFRMFQTVPGHERRESTGLGLALVKKLVEDQGGTITVDSAAGKGAVFRFTWPEAS